MIEAATHCKAKVNAQNVVQEPLNNSKKRVSVKLLRERDYGA
jgi:hypothetical protein